MHMDFLNSDGLVEKKSDRSQGDMAKEKVSLGTSGRSRYKGTFEYKST